MLAGITTFFNSLKVRIIFSALLMSIILLPIVGITISNAYEQHMNASIENELKAYVYSILAVAEVEEQQLAMPEFLLENQFNVDQSGLYAFFTKTKFSDISKGTVWRSASLISQTLPEQIQLPLLGEKRYYFVKLSQQNHFIYSFTVNFDDGKSALPLTLHIVKARAEIERLLADFRQNLWLALLILMAVLVAIQLVWLMWSLKPLTTLKKELLTIEQGQANAIEQHYPKELTQVTTQLNTLLQAEQNQRQRYRNALSDLAHSLKTPLAVINSQNDLSPVIQEQLANMNNMVEHQLKRAQSAGHGKWHLGVNLVNCVDKLVASLGKIYHDKQLNIKVDMQDDIVFKGDETDLFEIVGNLLDNACKAAKKNIQISAYLLEQGRKLQLVIEDDGEGIADNIREEILQRGTRADTYQQGHGIGLAIVRDLVASYQGNIQISSSLHLAGAKFTLIF